MLLGNLLRTHQGQTLLFVQCFTKWGLCLAGWLCGSTAGYALLRVPKWIASLPSAILAKVKIHKRSSWHLNTSLSLSVYPMWFLHKVNRKQTPTYQPLVLHLSAPLPFPPSNLLLVSNYKRVSLNEIKSLLGVFSLSWFAQLIQRAGFSLNLCRCLTRDRMKEELSMNSEYVKSLCHILHPPPPPTARNLESEAMGISVIHWAVSCV